MPRDARASFFSFRRLLARERRWRAALRQRWSGGGSAATRAPARSAAANGGGGRRLGRGSGGAAAAGEWTAQDYWRRDGVHGGGRQRTGVRGDARRRLRRRQERRHIERAGDGEAEEAVGALGALNRGHEEVERRLALGQRLRRAEAQVGVKLRGEDRVVQLDVAFQRGVGLDRVQAHVVEPCAPVLDADVPFELAQADLGHGEAPRQERIIRYRQLGLAVADGQIVEVDFDAARAVGGLLLGQIDLQLAGERAFDRQPTQRLLNALHAVQHQAVELEPQPRHLRRQRQLAGDLAFERVAGPAIGGTAEHQPEHAEVHGGIVDEPAHRLDRGVEWPRLQDRVLDVNAGARKQRQPHVVERDVHADAKRLKGRRIGAERGLQPILDAVARQRPVERDERRHREGERGVADVEQRPAQPIRNHRDGKRQVHDLSAFSAPGFFSFFSGARS